MVLRSLGHRAPLLWVVVPYAVGIVAGRALPGLPVIPALAGAGVALGVGFAGAATRPRLWALGLTTALVLIGAAAYTLQRARLPAWNTLPPREARVGLHLDHTFAPRWEQQVSGLATIIRTDPHLRDLIGQRIYFSLRLGPGESRPTRTAEIDAIGVIEQLPETAPGFAGHLAATGINFTFTRGRVLGETRAPTPLRRFCDATLRRFAAILGTGTAEKQPGFTAVLRAMLLGQKQELDEAQDELFLRSGTMHLFAISGLHIAAIAAGIEALLLLLRAPRLPRIGAGLLLVWLYVQVTGGAPSAVRAFAMVALFQAMRLGRRPGNPLAALAAAALAVLAVDPLQLFSVSFQLSYGVVAALLLYGLPLGETWQARFPAFPHLPRATWRWWHHLIATAWRGGLGAAGIAVAAGLVSWVTGVAYFGLFIVAAPLANLVLVPLATWVILAGIGSLLTGLTGFAAASALCNHAALLVLWGMEAGIRRMVAWPGTAVPAAFPHEALGPAAFAGLLTLFAWGYHRRWRGITASWWLPPGLVVALLIFGVNFG